MKGFKAEAIIIAIGLVMLGGFLKKAIDNNTNRSRIVTVKGVAEIEVPANKVTWPLRYTEPGNDLVELYDIISDKNDVIVDFLISRGVSKDEISIGAPSIYDHQGQNYNSDYSKYRYKLTSTITVTSANVDLIRKLMQQQSELIGKGIALKGDDYESMSSFEFTGLNDVKPQMIEEATKNARIAAEKFAKDSDSKIGKIMRANQGQFSITDRDHNTPHIKRVRVVTTIDYQLKD